MLMKREKTTCGIEKSPETLLIIPKGSLTVLPITKTFSEISAALTVSSHLRDWLKTNSQLSVKEERKEKQIWSFSHIQYNLSRYMVEKRMERASNTQKLLASSD